VIVDDTQLSLAIGKKGQNVRLAAKLLGWKIDIKSEEEKRQEVEQQMQALVGGPTTPLDNLEEEIGAGVIEKLREAGVTTVEGLADMHPEELEAIPGIGPKTIEKISLAVNNYFSSLEAGENPPQEPFEEQPEGSEEENETGPDSGGMTGDNTGISNVPEEAPLSENEMVETGQDYEAEVIEGVENAPPADEAEVSTDVEHHGEDNIPPEKQ
jgi:N utilization substance protein A